MSSLNNIKTELDNQLGIAERNRFGESEREAAINEALFIAYGLLSGSPIIKKSGTVTVSSNVATPPTDFNDGTVLFVGDASTYDNSNPIFELDQADFGRYDSTDDDYFTVNQDSNNDTQFQFNTVSSGTLYVEYEKGAPVLTNGTDDDGLPLKAKYITAKLAAAILSSNLMNDEDKMQTFLYGPSGNPATATPTSIMGELNLLRGKRRVGRARRAGSKITIYRSNPLRNYSNIRGYRIYGKDRRQT